MFVNRGLCLMIELIVFNGTQGFPHRCVLVESEVTAIRLQQTGQANTRQSSLHCKYWGCTLAMACTLMTGGRL